MKLAVISANMGGLDEVEPHVPQSVEHDYFLFNDKNFPPRKRSMTPRLQAKIPKFFGWQMVPGYDFYLWIDGNLNLTDSDSIKWLLDSINADNGVDIVVLKHPKRNTIKWEARYIERGLKQQSIYLTRRYENEDLEGQMKEMLADPDFVDDMLVNAGIFIYRNTPAVHQMMKEWWYLTSRYTIMDQCAFSYVLKKSGIRIKILEEAYNDCKYLKHKKHYWNR